MEHAARSSTDDPPVDALLVAPRTVHRVWLVRHGESTWNALGLVQGHVTTPVLTSRGQRQARRCAWALRGVRAAGVYASDLRRASQTANPIARTLGVDVQLHAGLRERSLGVAEGLPASMLRREWTGIADGRVVDADAAPPGGESVRDLYARATRWVAALLERHGRHDVVLVCHGGVVRVVQAWAEGIGPDEMAWGPVENGLIVSCRAPALRRTGQILCPHDGRLEGNQRDVATTKGALV